MKKTNTVDEEKYMMDTLTRYAEGYMAGLEDADDNWIPVEERLPSNMSNVLVTAVDPDGGRYTSTDRYDVIKGNWFRFNGSDKVIAWQPFPKAYRGDKDV